jgi:hypothetical protein
MHLPLMSLGLLQLPEPLIKWARNEYSKQEKASPDYRPAVCLYVIYIMGWEKQQSKEFRKQHLPLSSEFWMWVENLYQGNNEGMSIKLTTYTKKT